MYEQMVSDYVELTPINKVKLDELHKMDLLCDKCQFLSANELLCSGIRPFLSECATQKYGVIKVQNMPCSKRIHLFQQQALAARLKKSYIPPEQISALEYLPNSEIVDDYIYIDGRRLPKLLWAYTDIDLTKWLWKSIISLIKNGHSAKYVYPVFWYHDYKLWNELDREFIENCDWLVIERPDISSGPDYRRALVFSTIQRRVSLGKNTFITLSEDSFLKNQSEITFIEQIKKWSRFEL